MDKFDKLLATIVGLMSIFIVLYRIIKIMIPMLVTGIKEKDYSKALASFTQLV
uniref:Uncharacterized protein n=1 Tax=Nucleocytoviricota sp. TaxID=2809609 RepID=A0A9E8G656_9VIRU|nr:hypothetical protein [Nucleocytoviricota sp.]UZT29200.1 hypothetical protein [Nucleocytoviricota sp.]